jgi:hypothetical protein
MCPNYVNERSILRNTLSEITNFTLDKLLYGDDRLTLAENQQIFAAVHTFIKDSGRFVVSKYK